MMCRVSDQPPGQWPPSPGQNPPPGTPGGPSVPPYGPPPGGYPPPGSGYNPAPGQQYGGFAPPAAPKTNGLAIGGFVCSLLGCCGLLAIVGVILSAVALNQINKSGGTQGGKNYAIAGLVIGGIWLLISVILTATGNIDFYTNTTTG